MRHSRRVNVTALALASLLPVSAGVVATSRAFGAHDSDAVEQGACDGPTLERFKDELPIPMQKSTTDGPVALKSVNGTHQFHKDLPPTPTLGYVDATSADTDVYGGPTLIARSGQAATVTVKNQIQDHPLGFHVDGRLMGAKGHAHQPSGVVHLHGGATPPDSDGDPTDGKPHGAVQEFTYPNGQEATGLWYHDHSMGMTRLNVGAGLAGQYWLRDAFDTGEADNKIGLPADTYEVPLTLQDRSFHKDGRLCYQQSGRGVKPNTWQSQTVGNTAVVNGKAFPDMAVARGLYRFRLVNGSNARAYSLSLAGQDAAGNALAPNQMPRFYQIGSDGGLFNTPVAIGPTTESVGPDGSFRMTELALASGQRADLLIDFGRVPEKAKIQVKNSPVQGYGALPDIMQFTAGTDRGFAGRTGPGFVGGIPVKLRSGAAANGTDRDIKPLAQTDARRVRTVVLDFKDGGFFLNNRPFCKEGTHDTCDTAPPEGNAENQFVATPEANTVEDWYIVNRWFLPHPIHLHMTQFQVMGTYAPDQVDMDGFDQAWHGGETVPAHGEGHKDVKVPDVRTFLRQSATPTDRPPLSWNDTVNVPFGVTHIRVPFGGKLAGINAPFDGVRPGEPNPLTGDYVWHCHILEHEDNDMMQRMTVSPASTPPAAAGKNGR
jgi:spore coat protein A, manganese oxidase